MEVVTRALLLLSILALACTDNEGASRALHGSGFTDITLTGFSFGSCGKDDGSSTGFEAKNPQGERVSGVVCCGLIFKGCTVRF